MEMILEKYYVVNKTNNEAAFKAQVDKMVTEGWTLTQYQVKEMVWARYCYAKLNKQEK